MIIPSLLDTDLYKFTMMQVVLHHFPKTWVKYRFKCRTPKIDFSPIIPRVKEALHELIQLRLQPEELSYLSTFSYFSQDFLAFLRCFQLNADFVRIDDKDGFHVTVEGPWLHTILFEVPLLAIINQCYFEHYYPHADRCDGEKRLASQIQWLKAQEPIGFKFSDFGTRRRFSRDWHAYVLQQLTTQLSDYLYGTSNVLFAKQLGLTPIGTMAHEYIQAFQVLAPSLRESQRDALELWMKEYRGELAIALSDTYTQAVFLRDFDRYLAHAYTGVRHDSGDPMAWGEQLLKHYDDLGLDAKQKTFVFSDSLTFQSAVAIHQHFQGRVNTRFGIGSHLTNDLGYPRVDIVIKMLECNAQPVAKLSDNPYKSICDDPHYLHYLRQVMCV